MFGIFSTAGSAAQVVLTRRVGGAQSSFFITLSRPTRDICSHSLKMTSKRRTNSIDERPHELFLAGARLPPS